MDLNQKALLLHGQLKGKLDIVSKEKVSTLEQLSLLYSPGVASPCLAIEKDAELAFKYTIKNNMVAVVSNGTAVLGLGNIGALASLPVMEGKAILFKELANVNAFPICLDIQDPDELIKTVVALSPTFGGINLEDIKAPECFYIEKKLQELLDIPVFHDDQHGTAIVCTAGLLNALKVVNKKPKEVKVLINGMGSAGIAIALMLLKFDIRNLVCADRNGVIFEGIVDELMEENFINIMNELKEKPALYPLDNGVKNADVFIGVSAPNILSSVMIESMNKDAIIFAMANPNPEVLPEVALQAGAKIIATGRSDYPNQINNVLVFPAIFKGALAVNAKAISPKMKMAAVHALANYIKPEDLNSNYIIPDPFDHNVVDVLSQAVSAMAIEEKLNRIIKD